jgi:sugar lactone lactonase YvrE
VSTGGIITTVAGNGTGGYTSDGITATNSEINYSFGVAVDSSGNIYIADTYNSRIRKVSGGIITTIAGTGTPGYNGDSLLGTNAQVNFPDGVAADNSGNVYIADSANNRIRKITSGVITTLSTNVSGPVGLAALGSTLFIADTGNARIGRLSGGTITTIAGNGSQIAGDGGSATSASLGQPNSVVTDSTGNLYFVDQFSCSVRKVVAGGGTRNIRSEWASTAPAIC